MKTGLFKQLADISGIIARENLYALVGDERRRVINAHIKNGQVVVVDLYGGAIYPVAGNKFVNGRGQDVTTDVCQLYIIAHAAGLRQPGSWQPQQPKRPAPNPFREAGRLVNAVQENALPFLCGGHDGVPKRTSEKALRLLGNGIVLPIPQAIARFIHQILNPQPRKLKREI